MNKLGDKLMSVYIRLLWVAILILSIGASAKSAGENSEILKVDYEKLISRADIILNKPVSRRESGLPVGNGRMGSLVWTTPSALKFQINRDDVYANNCYTNSFAERDSDYGFGVGFVDVDFGDFGPGVFMPNDTHQHLSVYDGLLTLEGAGVKARILAFNAKDVFALEITDSRKQTSPISTVLRMLRPPRVRTRSHLAISNLQERNGCIILTQRFTEDYSAGSYYCSSALAIKVLGRKSQVKVSNDQELRIAAEPGKGSFTILMASAATFDRNEDVVASAVSQLDSAASEGFGGLLEKNKTWWHRFWTESFVHLHSADGRADYVEKHYTYYLYVMASSSRGKYPPRFGGMLWKTGGDFCRWGTQHWFHNLSCYYRALPESGRFELMDPMYDMYSGMYESCSTAARQIWGSKGLWIPETVGFDGLEKLPEDIAAEMRDLYLLRKPWGLMTHTFRKFADRKQPHCSPWNWKGSGRWINGEYEYKSLHGGPFGYLVHIPTTTAKVAYLFWLRYEYTMDKDWLRDRAYPMLKGTAEFFRNYPNVRKGNDGKYHVHNTNNHEPIRGCLDPMESLAAMYGILPVAIRASEILGVDADMRPVWQELLDNLTPLPTNDDMNSITPRKKGQPRFWTGGRKPYQGGSTDWGRLIPVVYYDLCTLENPDEELRETANSSFDHAYPNGFNAQTPVHVLTRSGIAAALMGRAEDVKYIIPNQIKQLNVKRFIDYRITKAGVMENRMTMREGAEAIGIQRLGRASAAMQYALLQSVPAAPGKEPVIRIFPAWPKEWDAEYTLLARGGFLVTSSMQNGQIEFVELQSKVVGECRLRNPWGEAQVTLYRNGAKDTEMSGSLLRFNTAKEESTVVVRAGNSPQQYRRTVMK